MSKKWKYRIVDSHEIPGVDYTDVRRKQDIQDYLNRLGQEGWEIINLDLTENQEFYNFFGVAKRALS